MLEASWNGQVVAVFRTPTRTKSRTWKRVDDITRSYFAGNASLHGLKVMRSRNFHSMSFPQIWYIDFFRVADMNVNTKKWDHRVRLVTMVTRISWFI